MSAKMTMPLNQQRHSNVAVVRVSKHGKRLELACYKNKVAAFRAGTETRLDEVLQIERVFANVSRGAYASLADIQKVLGPDFDETAALHHILRHGDVQVAQHERSVETGDLMKDICNIIAEKCVHPSTLRPYPPEIIEQSLRMMGVTIRQDQPAKKQALHFIHELVVAQVVPVKRADMKIRCTCPDRDALSAAAAKFGATQIASSTCEEAGEADSLIFLIEPSCFRELDEAMRDIGGAVQVLETAVMVTGEGGAEELQVAAAATDSHMRFKRPMCPERHPQPAPAEQPAAGSRAAKDSPGARRRGRKQLDALEDQLGAMNPANTVGSDDSDSRKGTGRRKGKAKKKGKSSTTRASSGAATPARQAGNSDDSDDALASANRKLRRKAKTNEPTAQPPTEADDHVTDDDSQGA